MRYQSTTGLSQDNMTELVARVYELMESCGEDLRGHRLGVYKQVSLTVMLLRQNISQSLAADALSISQPTVSRIYRRMLPRIASVLQSTGISLEDAVQQRHLIIVDSTYVPTGNRPASGQEKANYSGKHHTQCLSIQVACTHDGRLLATSPPVPGSRHDSAAIELCGWKNILNQDNVSWIADSAYISTTALTPMKKRQGQDRLDWEKQFNKGVSSMRAPVEHAIAHLKNWKVLSTRYRGRLVELPKVIATVSKLELYRIGW